MSGTFPSQEIRALLVRQVQPEPQAQLQPLQVQPEPQVLLEPPAQLPLLQVPQALREPQAQLPPLLDLLAQLVRQAQLQPSQVRRVQPEPLAQLPPLPVQQVQLVQRAQLPPLLVQREPRDQQEHRARLLLSIMLTVVLRFLTQTFSTTRARQAVPHQLGLIQSTLALQRSVSNLGDKR